MGPGFFKGFYYLGFFSYQKTKQRSKSLNLEPREPRTARTKLEPLQRKNDGISAQEGVQANHEESQSCDSCNCSTQVDVFKKINRIQYITSYR